MDMEKLTISLTSEERNNLKSFVKKKRMTLSGFLLNCAFEKIDQEVKSNE